MTPLVSCICPTTRSRSEWMPQLVACFVSQTYPERELIVIEGAGTIGAKRNRGCERAQGEFIVNFDDDDFCGPERVADQISRLIVTGKAVTGYRDLIFTDGERRWLNRNWPGGYGSTLAYRRDWWAANPYPDTSDGEDWCFVSAAMRANRFVVAPAGEHMVITIHPGNTSPRVIGEGWQEITPNV